MRSRFCFESVSAPLLSAHDDGFPRRSQRECRRHGGCAHVERDGGRKELNRRFLRFIASF